MCSCSERDEEYKNALGIYRWPYFFPLHLFSWIKENKDNQKSKMIKLPSGTTVLYSGWIPASAEEHSKPQISSP